MCGGVLAGSGSEGGMGSMVAVGMSGSAGGIGWWQVALSGGHSEIEKRQRGDENKKG